MSSKQGMEFGSEYYGDYAKVLESWTDKVKNSTEVDAELEAKWGVDLFKALSDPVTEALMAKVALAQWAKQDVDLPSKEALRMFSGIAAKYSLSYATPDLLRRLVRSVKEDKKNPPEDTVTAAIRVMRPSELVHRAPQTVAQIFDMAKDQFNDLIYRFQTRKETFTGRRRWVTVGEHGRHQDLDGEIRGPDEEFTYKKKSIVGPRPVGGNPADWSNCSCVTDYEKTDGKWVRVTD